MQHTQVRWEKRIYDGKSEEKRQLMRLKEVVKWSELVQAAGWYLPINNTAYELHSWCE